MEIPTHFTVVEISNATVKFTVDKRTMERQDDTALIVHTVQRSVCGHLLVILDVGDSVQDYWIYHRDPTQVAEIVPGLIKGKST